MSCHSISIQEFPGNTGLPYTIVSKAGFNSITVVLTVPVGSINEWPGMYGMSHMLEHMLAKGTRSYPTQDLLMSKIDSIGSFSLTTSKIETSGIIITSDEHLVDALNIIKEIFFYPLLLAKELAEETKVVIQEISNGMANVVRVLIDTLGEVVFDGTPLSRTIPGSIEEVKSIHTLNMRQYHDIFYRPDRCHLYITGNVDPAKLPHHRPDLLRPT